MKRGGIIGGNIGKLETPRTLYPKITLVKSQFQQSLDKLAFCFKQTVRIIDLPLRDRNRLMRRFERSRSQAGVLCTGTLAREPCESGCGICGGDAVYSQKEN